MSRLLAALFALAYVVLCLVCWAKVDSLDETTFVRLAGLAVFAGLLAAGAGIVSLKKTEAA